MAHFSFDQPLQAGRGRTDQAIRRLRGRQRPGHSTVTVAWHKVYGSCEPAARRSRPQMKWQMRPLRFPVKPKVPLLTARTDG